MRLIQVDVVSAEPLEAGFQLRADALGPQAFEDLLLRRPERNAVVVRVEVEVALLAVPDQPAFRGEHDLIAATGDGAADDLLGFAKAVDRSGVDHVNAAIERGENGIGCVLFIRTAPHPTADGPSAESDRRDV